VAALTAHKDHATLLEAAVVVRAQLPDACLVIVGEGELASALQARAAALGLGAAVVFAGFRRDLDALLPAFDVFCLSSHMEGLGTSLLDAMCYGRPVVATAAGGIPEALEDGVTGRVVPPRSPVALGQALVEVLRDQGRREAMGAAGRRRFLERFTADRMVEDTLGVYAEVA
jgi:glycosyltransferase involved in cell wall biosynthesis